jgi:hypothetical protein
VRPSAATAQIAKLSSALWSRRIRIRLAVAQPHDRRDALRATEQRARRRVRSRHVGDVQAWRAAAIRAIRQLRAVGRQHAVDIAVGFEQAGDVDRGARRWRARDGVRRARGERDEPEGALHASEDSGRVPVLRASVDDAGEGTEDADRGDGENGEQ